MRLALVGAMYSGKTRLANYMRDEHGVTVLSYTDSLKVKLVDALNAIGVRVTLDDVLANKKVYRPLLQELGSFLGYDEGYGVRKMVEQWQALGSPEPVIFDNVRFPAQWEMLKEYGFVLVGMQVSRGIQVARARGLGVSDEDFAKMASHNAESWFDCEIALDADKPTEDLADVLLRLAGMPVSRPRRSPSQSKKAA